ncbi:MAG: Mu-like prophage major head subunit gpT family protein [Phycisphaerae bacterium]|nr:Mu-like prophage major head subunit gpT family protein [Phycisphaerae bacterium]NUQ48212.1 Mu-like prophage major head subunit gpT family protein [Phycisphaerae bacterium]
MAAVIDTGLITKGLRSEFFSRFEAAPVLYRDLTTRIVSTSDRETYRWLGAVPQMREWGAGRLARGVRSESYSIENLKYEATIEVDRDELADDQTGQIRLRIAELAMRAATHKDFLISQLLIGGESTGLAYDGVAFFSDAHASGSSGAQNNKLSSEAVAPESPSIDEFKAALKAAIAAMLSFRDDVGEPMPIGASGLVCLVPPTLLFTALEALNATVVGNASNVLQGVARVASLSWLSDPTTWYLLKTDAFIRPFIFQDREPVEFTALTEGSDEGFRREKYLFGARARYRLTYGYWQFAVRSKFVEAS